MTASPEIPPELQPDWQRLLAALSAHDSLLVSFSGGADSSLLLAAALHVLGPRRVKAALCLGQLTPPWERAAARELAAGLEVELIELDARELEAAEVLANGPERCYFCKRRRLELLLARAGDLGIRAVAEGSQADDDPAERPGARAVAELGVLSPLRQAGLGKAQVRALGRALGLAAAGRPSGACLATRIPTGQALSQAALQRVAKAEQAIRTLLPGQVRVRDRFPLARLELGPEGLALASAEPLKQRLLDALRSAGYENQSLDVAGYHGAEPKAGR